MKIKVTKSAIESAAVILSKVINAKNPLPILGEILCEVRDHAMHLTGGDGEISITMAIGLLEMEGEGEFCVDAGKLLAALRQIPEQPITITCTTESDYMFTIEHQDGQAHFPAENSDEYPKLTEEKWHDAGIEINESGRIGEAVKRCLWAVCTDDMRPVMSGVHFAYVAKYDTLDIVASNGHALVRNRLTEWNTHGYVCKIDATIPAKAAKVMADTLTDNDEPMWLRFSDDKCEVETDRYTMITRLIALPYPKYNSVIPSDNSIEACVDRKKLEQAVKRVLPFAPDSSQMISLYFDDSELTICGDDFDFSMGARDKVPVEFNSTEPLSIGLKGSTLQKALGYIRNLDVRIKMSDPSRAVLLEPKEQPKTEVTILMMPMLLNE